MKPFIFRSVYALGIICLSLLGSQASFASGDWGKEVNCSSDTHFSKSCNQCFITPPLYQGYEYKNLSDIWTASAAGDTIFMDENPNIVQIDPYKEYAGNVLRSNIGSDSFFWTAQQYNDTKYGVFKTFKPNEKTYIVKAAPEAAIGFSTVTPAVQKNKRSKPLYEFRYTFRFFQTGDWNNLRTHQECVLTYPAFCGDGIVDKDKGEVCDDGDENGKPGKCSLDCKKTTPPEPEKPTTLKCDQYFQDTLRVGKQYRFFDKYTNHNAFPHILKGFSVNFRESDDMNNDGILQNGPNAWKFTWSAGMGEGVTIPAGTKDARIIEAVDPYAVIKPPKKRQKDNLAIDYIITTEGGGETSSHVECITYEVTWCGDGILDSDEGEICDPADPSKQGWGPGGCDQECKPIDTPSEKGLDLAIKKYIDTDDAQPDSPVSKKNGDTFDYVLRVQNISQVTATGKTTVKDVLPSGVEMIGNPSGDNWSCSVAGRTVSCTTNQEIAPSKFFSDIRVPVKVTAGKNATVRNDAAVHNPNEENSCYDDNRIPNGDEKECEKDPKNTDPGVFITPGDGGLDLAIKKYIDTDDAQPDSPVSKKNGDTFDYVLRVQNISQVTATGKTTVKDVLPSGVEMIGNPSGDNWSCSVAGRTVSCTTNQEIAPSKFFSDIRVPVKVTAGKNATVRNDAAVHNPNEENSCYDDNRIPNGDEKECEKDPKNTDPGVFKTPDDGGGNIRFYVPICISPTQNVCATKVYTTKERCEVDHPGICYQEVGSCERNVDQASKDKPECNEDTPPPHKPECGDGILDPGEECDDGSLNGTPASYCTKECKLIGAETNPGANPITDIWMMIPDLSATKIGTSFLDAQKQLRFKDNRVIIGKNTNLFTYADKVELGIDRKFIAPFQIESDKRFCMQVANKSTIISGEPTCMLFGENKSNLPQWTQSGPNGKTYAVFGKGTFLMENNASFAGNGISCGESGPQYRVCRVDGENSVQLFQGSQLRQFVGTEIGAEDMILQYQTIELARFPVRVSSALVGSLATASNRILEKFVNLGAQEYLKSILADGLSITENTSLSNNQLQPSKSNNLPVAPIKANITKNSPGTVYSMKDFSGSEYNGNPNIFAVKGDLTVACKDGSTFDMTGVKTVLVEGNITFSCNVVYPSNNADASWAWIAKGGNIIIDNEVKPSNTLQAKGITNLAGVYVALKENMKGGEIRAKDDKTTDAILRIEGVVYGNAEALFNSRTYARATTEYSIITPGTILTYSNRALRNPPPLLSQYLNNYKVDRVVK